LYPLKEWDELMLRINKLNRFNKKNIDFIRRFTAGVRQIDIDISGRILIPKDLINHAKISKDIVVSSAVNILEIWDKGLYEEAIDDAKGDFGNLAEDVMGDKTDNNVS
jgi:MraZ protein